MHSSKPYRGIFTLHSRSDEQGNTLHSYKSLGAIPELLPNECLFTAKSPDEIVKVLNNIDKEYLTRNAERNFLKSDNYTEINLDKIRHQFFDKIKASIFN